MSQLFAKATVKHPSQANIECREIKWKNSQSEGFVLFKRSKDKAVVLSFSVESDKDLPNDIESYIVELVAKKAKVQSVNIVVVDGANIWE